MAGPDGEHDGWPLFLRAVSVVRPLVAVAENVPGMEAFEEYWQYIQLALAWPSLPRGEGESWEQHWQRLQQQPVTGRDNDVHVVKRVAADYGDAQTRERVFVVAFDRRLGLGDWQMPAGQFSKLALQHDQAPGGTYWDRHKIEPRYERVPQTLPAPDGKRPWRTIRDVIACLPQPRRATRVRSVTPEDQFGARPRHHTIRAARRAAAQPPPAGGSWRRVYDLDQPMATVTTVDDGLLRVQDPQTGEWEERRPTLRELMDIMGLPREMVLAGSKYTAHRTQVGNGVPLELGKAVVDGVADPLAQRLAQDTVAAALAQHPAAQALAQHAAGTGAPRHPPGAGDGEGGVAAAAAFADLAERRASEGIPQASEPGGAKHTRTRLDVGGRRFYGKNGSRAGHPVPERVSHVAMDHAEGDAFGQAARAGIRGGQAHLYVDRVDRGPCIPCTHSMAGLARWIGLAELRVRTPAGLYGTYQQSLDSFDKVVPDTVASLAGQAAPPRDPAKRRAAGDPTGGLPHRGKRAATGGPPAAEGGAAGVSAFHDLVNLRTIHQIPQVSEPGGTDYTRARLDVGGHRFYGQNAPGAGHPVPEGVTEQTMTHAEGDAFGQAAQAGLHGDEADLWVDQVPCRYCRSSMAGLAQSIGLRKLEVWTPKGRDGIYTSSVGRFNRRPLETTASLAKQKAVRQQAQQAQQQAAGQQAAGEQGVLAQGAQQRPQRQVAQQRVARRQGTPRQGVRAQAAQLEAAGQQTAGQQGAQLLEHQLAVRGRAAR